MINIFSKINWDMVLLDIIQWGIMFGVSVGILYLVYNEIADIFKPYEPFE